MNVLHIPIRLLPGNHEILLVLGRTGVKQTGLDPVVAAAVFAILVACHHGDEGSLAQD